MAQDLEAAAKGQEKQARELELGLANGKMREAALRREAARHSAALQAASNTIRWAAPQLPGSLIASCLIVVTLFHAQSIFVESGLVVRTVAACPQDRVVADGWGCVARRIDRVDMEDSGTVPCILHTHLTHLGALCSAFQSDLLDAAALIQSPGPLKAAVVRLRERFASDAPPPAASLADGAASDVYRSAAPLPSRTSHVLPVNLQYM